MFARILKKLFLMVACTFLTGVICVCTYKITYKILDYRISEKKLDAIAEKYVSVDAVNDIQTEIQKEPVKDAKPEIPKEEPDSVVPDTIKLGTRFPVSVEFGKLIEENEDVIGWICLPDSKINYPVVKGIDNDFYLHRSLDKEYSYGGTIFLDAGCRSDWSGKNNILYGHNMNDGSMFASLMKYKQQEYCNENPYMYLATPEGNYRLDVFAGFISDPEEEIYTTVFTNEASFASWYENMRDRSMISSDVLPSPDSRILTMSTCTYERNDARFVLLLLMRPVEN